MSDSSLGAIGGDWGRLGAIGGDVTSLACLL